MPAQGDVITFQVTAKTISQVTVIDENGLPAVAEVTSVTFIPLNEGQVHISVSGSFTIVTDDPDAYTLGTKYDATFEEKVDEPIPTVV